MDLVAPDFVALHARLQPGREACHDLATGRRWTYAALDQAITSAAAGLQRRHGIAAGDRVAALARNSADLLIAHLACSRLGAIFVPLNWRLAMPELMALVADCTPALLLHDAAHAEAAAALAGPRRTAADTDLADDGPAPALAPRDAAAPSIILYTSGTSGRPKGAVLSERSCLFTALNFSLLGRVDNASAFLCDAPMFHVIGLITSIRSALMAGGRLAISPGFDPAQTLDRLGDPAMGITHYFCVPQMAQRLRDHPAFDPARLRGLTALFTGGAPNPADTILRWLDEGVPMADGYGMTEAGTVLGMPVDPDRIRAKAGSAGLPAPTLGLRLVDDAGVDVPSGVAGEIWLKGPNLASGYWNRPAETAAAFGADGWFRTGDIARRDADGFVTLIDRKKDMYISGGENVYPAEVEAVLLTHGQVAEVAVIGIADARWGEVGCAFVVWSAGPMPDAEILRAHCHDRIARYKIPHRFVFVDSLPRTGSGKVLKPALRAQMIDDAGQGAKA